MCFNHEYIVDDDSMPDKEQSEYATSRSLVALSLVSPLSGLLTSASISCIFARHPPMSFATYMRLPRAAINHDRLSRVDGADLANSSLISGKHSKRAVVRMDQD